MYKVYGNVLSTGTKERTKEVLGGFGHKRVSVCVSLFRHSNRGLITKGTIGSPVGKRPPFAKRVQNI